MYGLVALRSCPPAHGFLFHHRHSGAVDLRIQHGNGRSHNDWQVQLHGPLDLGLLAGGDVFPDGLRRALHGLGGHLQVGQEFQLLASVIEGGLLTDDCLHAAHSWRELGVFDIQFDIGGELSAMAVRAQVVGTRDGDLAHGRQHRLGAQFLIASPMAASSKECCAARPPGRGIAATRPAPWRRRGAWPNGGPSRWPPDRGGPSCGAPGR